MYSIDFENLHKAAEIIYCFMTLPALTKPECTLWNDDGFPDTVTNTGKGFMSEEKFCRWIVNSDFAAISCVASTDKEDGREFSINDLGDDRSKDQYFYADEINQLQGGKGSHRHSS